MQAMAKPAFQSKKRIVTSKTLKDAKIKLIKSYLHTERCGDIRSVRDVALEVNGDN
jgi:hypothetical protein